MSTITVHQPTERGAYEVVRDLAAASNRLNTIAADWAASQYRRGDITTASNLLEGMRSLLGELRANSTDED